MNKTKLLEEKVQAMVSDLEAWANTQQVGVIGVEHTFTIQITSAPHEGQAISTCKLVCEPTKLPRVPRDTWTRFGDHGICHIGYRFDRKVWEAITSLEWLDEQRKALELFRTSLPSMVYEEDLQACCGTEFDKAFRDNFERVLAKLNKPQLRYSLHQRQGLRKFWCLRKWQPYKKDPRA